jgi:malate/lactate dehydrogenase
MELVITVYGFGEVGSLVAALINSNFSNCILNVMNTKNQVSGRVLDLQHAAACNNNQILHNSHSSIPLSDFIIYAAGFSNVHGESRNSVALKNKQLVYELFSNIPFTSKTKIIAVTNPVDPISYWISDAIKGKATVIGTGTALDTFRLKHILSEHFEAKLTNVTAKVIGEHGQHMVPLFSQSKIEDKYVIDVANEKELKGIEEKLVKSAFEIRETEQATKYGIAQTCLELIQAFLSEKSIFIPVSIGIIEELQREFNCKLSIFISLDCEISQEGIKISSLKCSSTERLNLKLAATAIEEIILNTTE